MEDHLCAVKNFYQRILLPVSYSVVFLLGFGLNGGLLWCVCFRTRRWSSMVIYLSNLAAADLLYVLSLPPLIISNAMGDLWPFGDITCKAVRFFFFVNLHCSMLFLTCVSVHRFIGVCYPLETVRIGTRRLALFASASAWLLAVTELLPTLYYSHTGFINNITVCFEMVNPAQFKVYFPYGVFLTIVGFLIPFLVVIFCYCSVLKVLCSRALNSRRNDWRNKSLRTLLLVCLLFVVFFLPYHIARTVYMFVRVYRPGDCQVLNAVMIDLIVIA